MEWTFMKYKQGKLDDQSKLKDIAIKVQMYKWEGEITIPKFTFILPRLNTIYPIYNYNI